MGRTMWRDRLSAVTLFLSRGCANRSWRGDLLRLLSSAQFLSLLDQAVVSAASLATTVMVSRWTSPGELGVFAIGTSVLVSMLATQDALVALPYAILKRQGSGSAQEQAGSALVQSAMLSLACAALLYCFRDLVTRDASSGNGDLEWVALALACAAPFSLLRDFGRRFNFAHLELQKALVLDCCVAGLQLALLIWIGATGRLTAASAFAVIGGVCALFGVAWLWRSRRAFAFAPATLLSSVKQSWGLGRWLLFGQLTVQAQTYAMTWLSAALLGAASTGVYAACVSVIALSNPLILGLSNILTPRAVLALNQGGGDRLRAQAIRDALTLAGIMSVFCLVAVIFGEDLMRFLYRGQEYAGQGGVLTVLALAQLALVIGSPASNALKSLQQPRASALAAFLGAAATLLLVWLLMLRWDLAGAAYGLLIGNLTGSMGRWAMFLYLVPRSSEKLDEAKEALRLVSAQTPLSDWRIKRSGEGSDGVVYFAQSVSGHRFGADELVVKVWKSDHASAGAQAAKLSRLSAVFDGAGVGSWRLLSPRPLATSMTPPAMVMTCVPGRDLNRWMADGEELTPVLIDEIADVTVHALRRCWSRGENHGDLALQNILCDLEAKCLSLIDAETRDEIPGGRGDAGAMAAADLAGLLSDVAADVKASIGNAAARQRRQHFVKRVFRRYLDTLQSKREKLELLRDVAGGARTTIEGWLPRTLTPRGLWRCAVRAVALRRLRRLIAEVEAEAGLLSEGAESDRVAHRTLAQPLSSVARKLVACSVLTIGLGMSMGAFSFSTDRLGIETCGAARCHFGVEDGLDDK